jgi:hypothetical protein
MHGQIRLMRIHETIYLQCAIDLTLLHQVTSTDTFFAIVLAALYIFRQVQLDESKHDPLPSRTR